MGTVSYVVRHFILSLGDFRDERDAVFAFDMKVQEMVV